MTNLIDQIKSFFGAFLRWACPPPEEMTEDQVEALILAEITREDRF